MNRPPVHSRNDSGLRAKKTFSAAVAALAAALLALNSSPSLKAATGGWLPSAAVTVTITGTDSWTVSPTLVEGDAVFVGTTTGVNLGTSLNYYYVVGVGSTPSSQVRFSSAPASVTFSPNGTNSPLTVTQIPAWSTVGNWAGSVVPNGIDDAATIATSADMTAVMLDRDITLGALTVDTTVSSASGLSLITSTRTDGPASTLTLQSSAGTPTVTLRGGNSFSFSESKISGATPANSGAKLALIGTQGLVIDNQNTVTAPIAVNSGSVQTPVSNVPTFGSGQVRFGFGLDWSKFSGDLTLARGVFQPLAGGSLNNNLSALPLRSKLVLGTGSNTARLEIPSNSGNNPGSTLVRGLESTSPNSSIINTSAIAVASPTPANITATFEVGSYGLPTDSFTYAGNIGDSTYASSLFSVSALRFVKVGPGTQILSGVNNMNAASANTVLMAVNGGKLSLGTTGAIGTINPDSKQGVANSDSSLVLKNGEFELSGLGISSKPRSQAFGGLLIFGTLAPNTTNSDANFAAQSNSASTVTVIADPSQPTTLTFGVLKPRNLVSGNPDTSNLNGATMLYRGTSLGATPGVGVASILFTTAPTVSAGSLFALGGSDALNNTQAPVLKGALADTSPTGYGVGFATYDPTNGVRLLAANEQKSVASGPDYNAASSNTNDNILFNLAADEAITGHLSNTLQIKNTSGLSRTLTNTGTEFNAANGLLFSGTDPIVLTGGQITGTSESNAADVVIHSINSSSAGVTIQAPVSNTGTNTAHQGWITYAGKGNIRLEGVQTVGNLGGLVFNNRGTTTVAASIVGATNLSLNQGIVKLATGASWTNIPRLFMAPEAKLDLNGVGSTSTTNRFSDISAAYVGNGSLVANPGGELTNSSATTVDVILSAAANGATSAPFWGTLTGNLNLVVDKSSFNSGTQVYTYGTQALGNANTYTGSTQIRSGVLNLARGGSLPPTTVVTLGPVALTAAESYANSTLSLGDANGSTNGSVRLEIAGLYATGIGAGLGTVATGNGTAAVINASSNVSLLTLNIAEGTDNVFIGNLGIAVSAIGNSQNLFGLRKIGPGSFEPAGAINTYSGGTVVQGGILRVSADAKLGQIGSLTGAAGSSGAPVAPLSAFPNNIVLDGGALQVTNAVSTDFVLNSLRGIGLGPVAGSTGGTGTLWVNSGVTLTYGGIIASAGNTGTQTLVKNGTGLLSLTGASTFTGVTQVAAGTLGGTGSLASGVTVNSGGVLSPGVAGKGTFTINGPLTFNAGSAFNVDLAAPATPGVSDLVQLAGGAVSATGTTTVNITALAGFGVGSYTLISGGGAVSASNFVVGAIPSGYNGTFSASGGVLTLTIAVGAPLTGLESWRQANFGTSSNTGNAADTADADNDGVVNLLEYATGTNPNVANVSPISVARSGNFLTLTYTRIADTTLTYTVEGTNDLTTSWATVTTANNPSTGAMNTAGPVTVTDTTAVTSRRFLRLKVSY